MSEFDGVIVGGGHNGLIVAAYMAKAGLKVIVVERSEKVGGGCTTDEVTLPGFRHNLHSNFYLGFDDTPFLRDLDLGRYGFAFFFPPIAHAIVFRDRSALLIHRDPEKTCRSLARFSERDARTYRELHEKFAIRLKPLILSILYSAPLSPQELKERIRGPLGSEFLSFSEMTIYEAADRYFEHDRIRTLFKAFIHALTLENLPGSGLFFPRVLSRVSKMGLVVGGSGNFPLALCRLIESEGGTCLTGAHVERILVRDGVATGVELSDGRRIAARQFVASAIDAPGTIRLTGEEHFSPSVVEKMRNWKWAPHSLVTLHLALREPPRYAAAAFDPDVDRTYDVIFGADSSEELGWKMDEVTRGELPSEPLGQAACNTLFDPTYAPAGRHIAFWWPHAPYALNPGGPSDWDIRRAEIAGRLLDIWRRYAPNLNETNVLASYLHTPLDIERRIINMVRGNQQVGAHDLNQLGIHRPHPELSRYRTPVERLFLCGSSSHATGSVTGSPGYNAANAIAEALGIRKWWTPVPPPEWSG